MFKLKFPSGATLKFIGTNPNVLPTNETFDGTLYIWPEDLEPLLEITQREKEQNDNPMSRESEQNRDEHSNR